MRIRDLLSIERILPDVGTCHVVDAIKEACRSFSSAHPERVPAMVQNVLMRWRIGPPVAAHVGYVEELASSWPDRSASLARSCEGIDYGAKNGNRVHILVVCLGPRDIFTTIRFRRLLENRAVYEDVMAAQSGAEILRALDVADLQYPEDDKEFAREAFAEAKRRSSS